MDATRHPSDGQSGARLDRGRELVHLVHQSFLGIEGARVFLCALAQPTALLAPLA